MDGYSATPPLPEDVDFVIELCKKYEFPKTPSPTMESDGTIILEWKRGDEFAELNYSSSEGLWACHGKGETFLQEESAEKTMPYLQEVLRKMYE